MSNIFFIIVHADRLHEREHRNYPDTDYFRKNELIASILEQRLFRKSKEVLDRGGHVYFMGSMPSYLKNLNGICYIPDELGGEDQFEVTARQVQKDGGQHVLVAGIYSFACIHGLIHTELRDMGITAEVDPNLTDQFFDEYEIKTEEELQAILEREAVIRIDPTISRK